MNWVKGGGILGPLEPLLGHWITIIGEGPTPAASMVCSRHFTRLGTGWIELDARWQIDPSNEYRERAIFGKGDGDQLTCFSFTSDGKKSIGQLTDATDVHNQAIAFEADMRAGKARMIYWPLDNASRGFQFAAESKTENGWDRFLFQQFGLYV